MTTLKINSVNISEQKGTVKKPVKRIALTHAGVGDDAHAGDWHRQVSLLGTESIQKFEKQNNRTISYGEFAENITTTGFPLYDMRPLDLLKNGYVEMQVTQIGKKCHGDNCAIFQEIGNCVMPKEGIFARVIRGGELAEGMKLTYHPKTFNVLVITLSDRASKGEYKDKSGPFVAKQLKDFFHYHNRYCRIENKVIPDHAYTLKETLLKAVNKPYDLIVTTGGTGIGSRDITTPVIRKTISRELKELTDYVKYQHAERIPAALLSTSIAGVINKTMVLSLPGSTKAVKEYLHITEKSLMHAFYMLHGLGH
ncbi:MAG: hypothetical protein K9I47_07425 [Bacteroidales bacterium]|nr:hypothetical protein [Bacteroidales bacterium]